jgi:LEA14-like dessication related protein
MVVLKILKYLVITLVALVALVAIGFFLGVFGVPQLNGIDNEFGTVNETQTEIRTDVSIHNPNPIGLSVGGLNIDYTIGMNEIRMANGTKQGLSLGTGNSSLQFVTYLDNGKIPEWWYTHIRNGERTNVGVNATVSHGALGSAPPITQSETIETDILSAFDSTETREINADRALVDDPVLYLNETAGEYGENLTPQQTPIDLGFTVYNPKAYPYAVTEIGYNITMNGIPVGDGTTTEEQVLAPRTESTLTAETILRNERLDQWWVSHLNNDEVTDLRIDFYVVVDPDIQGVDPVRIDSDELDYQTTIETNILGQGADTSGNTSTSNSIRAPNLAAPT